MKKHLPFLRLPVRNLMMIAMTMSKMKSAETMPIKIPMIGLNIPSSSSAEKKRIIVVIIKRIRIIN